MRIACLLCCLLVLSGCSGRKQERPSPSRLKESTASTETTVWETEIPGTEPPEIEAPDKWGDIPFTQRVQGVYRGKRSDGIEVFTEVRCIGPGLLLEVYLEEEGIPADFWAEEFWPEDGWLYAQGNTLKGMSQCYSGLYAQDTYWGPAQPRTLTLTEAGLHLTGPGETFEMTRESAPVLRHSLPEEMGAILPPSGNGDPVWDVPGTWSYYDGERAAILTLSADGSLTYGFKTADIPLVWLTGVWRAGETEGSLQCAAERIGYGKMPFVFSLELSGTGQTPVLTHAAGDILYLPEGRLPFQPGTQAWHQAAFLAAGAVG